MRMKKVHELVDGMVFTLPCEGHCKLYSFVRNDYRDDMALDRSVVRPIAGWWPKDGRGEGIPGHWCYNDKCGEQYCNPYADALLAFPRDASAETE